MRNTKYAMLSLVLFVSLIFVFPLPVSAAPATTGTPKVVFIGKPIDGMLYLGDDNTVLAKPSNGKTYFLDLNGKVLLSAKQLDDVVKKAGGKVAEGYEVMNFSDGYAVIEYTPVKKGEDEHMSIYIDKKGSIAFSAPGTGGYVNDGIAIVNSSSGDALFSRAYDMKGNLIASIKGNNGTFASYGNGMFVRYFGKENKYVDNNNKSLFKGESFGWAGPFGVDPITPVADYEGTYGFINTSGEVVIDFTLGGVAGDSKTRKYINDGLIAAQDKTTALWGFIDATGKVIIPFEHDYADTFSNGFARVRGKSTSDDGQHGGKFGYIDTTGKVVIPQIYDFMTTMINGYCVGEKNNVCTIYDTTGMAYKTPKLNLGYIDTYKDVSVFIYDAPGGKKGMATIQVGN